MNFKNYDWMELLELLQVQMAKVESYEAKGWHKIYWQQLRIENAIVAELNRREEALKSKN